MSAHTITHVHAHEYIFLCNYMAFSGLTGTMQLNYTLNSKVIKAFASLKKLSPAAIMMFVITHF